MGSELNDEPVFLSSHPQTAHELQHYIPYLLARLANTWNVNQSRDLAPFGINGTILRTLSALNINGTLTINEIAGYTFVEQSHASRTVDQMVAAGLVVRAVSKADQRRRQLALTEKGNALLKEVLPLVSSNYRELVADLPPELLRDCVTCLLLMVRNIEKSPDEKA